jgi:ubiquinone/menaquinone biosynthesis C-methylase UbiE
VAHPDPKRANTLYHDAAATSYDGKWAISFEDRAVGYVRERARRMLPRDRYHRALEVGSGTGFWILNLWQAGYVERAHATDISPGMLAVCAENARRLGCDVELRVADADRLPYPDGSFDLVCGHAFLHHLPDPEASLAEMARVLAPGGGLMLAGEPTRWGHRLAGVSKVAVRSTIRAAGRLPALRGLRPDPAPPPATEEERILRELEHEVDLHTFDPSEVISWTRGAGLGEVRVETEELLASVFGWAVRTAESEVRPGLLGRRWARFAFRAWRGLYEVDRLLYPFLPRAAFYNLLLYGEKPRA